MPKGQYDRTKTKAQRDAEKKNAAPEKAEKVGKRKYTKRAQVEAAPALGPAQHVGVKNEHRDLFADTTLFNTFAGALKDLKGTAVYDAVITKLGVLVERLEPAPKQSKKVEAAAEKTEFVPAPNAVPAPIPYTPSPIPFNGSNPQ